MASLYYIEERRGFVLKVFRGVLVVIAASVMSIGAAGAESGVASVHSYKGSRTASGETGRSSELTAAHRTLAFGTRVEVTNTRNGKTVVVRINDRGPFTTGRIIDLTPAAASILDFSGVTPVSIAIVK